MALYRPDDHEATKIACISKNGPEFLPGFLPSVSTLIKDSIAYRISWNTHSTLSCALFPWSHSFPHSALSWSCFFIVDNAFRHHSALIEEALAVFIFV